MHRPTVTITPDEMLEFLRDAKKLGTMTAPARFELIGDIDPLRPDLSESERRMVLRACKKSPPFFLWLLKQATDTPALESSDVLWGPVQAISMKGSVFHSIVSDQVRRLHSSFRGKDLSLSGWLFKSGDMCVIASAVGNSKPYKYIVRTAEVVVTRNGGRLVPANIPPKHLAGLFDKEWAENERK